MEKKSQEKQGLKIFVCLEIGTNKAVMIYRGKFEYREARETRIVNPIYVVHGISLYWMVIIHRRFHNKRSTREESSVKQKDFGKIYPKI